jgi:O-methyltransferase
MNLDPIEKIVQGIASEDPSKRVAGSSSLDKLSNEFLLNELARYTRSTYPDSRETIAMERDAHMGRYHDVVKQLHHCFTENVFPELPYREERNPLLEGLLGTSIPEAMWILRGLNASLQLDGEVCEFGCAHGATSVLLANEITSTFKHLWLFDSFKGLSKPSEEDELIDDIFGFGTIAAYEGAMSYPPYVVRAKLNAIGFPENRIHVRAGFIEETLNSDPLPGRVCFAYVDFDFYEPIRRALDFLSKALILGGRIVVDDYGFFSAGAQKAVDEFIHRSEERFHLSLPPEWAGRFALLTKIK